MPVSKSLPPVSSEALDAFKAQGDAIIRAVVARSMELTEQVAGQGDQAVRLLTSGLRYTTIGLQTAIFLRNTALLDWQLSWAADRLRHDGVMPAHILTMLEIYAEVVEDLLAPELAQVINPYVRWMIDRQREIVQSSASASSDRNRHL